MGSTSLKAEDTVDLADFLVDRQLGNQRGPLKFLARLHKVVHTEPVIAYYEEDDRDLDKVLDIFIRTNSGGTTLSYSDMLMSMATAQWTNLDAREEIYGTVDEINQIGDGFGFSRRALRTLASPTTPAEQEEIDGFCKVLGLGDDWNYTPR